MALFRLRSAGPTAGDCTAPYDVIFNRECTVREFIQEVLTKKEWGMITVGDRFNGLTISYSDDKIKSSVTFPDDILDKVIKSATSHGGWSNMDYVLDIWEASDKLRFEYAQTLKEIVRHESEVKKLQRKAHDLEEKMERIEKGEVYSKEGPPPHLDRDGCVYWDSVIKKENYDEG